MITVVPREIPDTPDRLLRNCQPACVAIVDKNLYQARLINAQKQASQEEVSKRRR